MSNDIKIVDYIPENRQLCVHCIYRDDCPYDYMCPSLIRLTDYEAENGEL